MQKFLLGLLLFASFFCYGQLLPFKLYTDKDGLNSKVVYSSVRDDRGLLWVGTPFGINWFDGTHFFQPSVPKKVDQLYVERFFKDKQGIIWTLTFYNGFYKFQNDHFTQYLIDSSYSDANKNNIMDMTQMDASHYVVAADRGAYLFDGKNFNRIDAKNLDGQIGAVLFVKNYLLAGFGNGINCYQYNKGWKLVSKNLTGISVNKIFFNNDHLWAATDKGLYYFNQFNFTRANQLSSVYKNNELISDVAMNANGEVWFPCKGIVFKISKGKLIAYPRSTGLNAVTSHIYFDDQNIGWFSTRDGLYKLTQEYYSFKKNLLGVASIARSNNKIWISYPNGFSDISGKDHFKIANGFAPVILYNAPLSHTFWITTRGEMFVMNDHRLQKKYSLSCSALYEDNDGTTWIATNDGRLFSLKNDQLQPIYFNSFPDDFISGIIKDKNGFVWLGFRTGGILRCRYENENLKTVNEFSSKTGFPDLRIRSSHADANGNILFGTRTNGLFIFSTGTNYYWHINNSNGLNATWVRSIDSDDSSVYLATNNGVFILKTKPDYSHSSIRSVKFFNDEISNEINCVLADNGQTWAGCNGTIQLFPKKFDRDTLSPSVFITQVSIEGKPDSMLIPYGHQQNQLHLPYNRNVIAFEFAGVNLKDEEPLQYRYKLEGQDKDWNVLTGRNFVSYNLPPGRYRFLVQALNAARKWSTQTASYSFVIAQPFWTTWWFVTLNILFAIGIIYLIYRYRLQQAMKFERLRYKISTDLHDDIGSTLSSISILSDMALTESSHQQNASMVAEIKENSLNLMEKMDDIVWSINPKNDSLGSLLLRIKRFSSRLFEAKDIDYSIDIDKAVDEIRLPMEYRQHIYLIMKEAINNLVKYSEATKAAIEVHFLNSLLKIRVSDNGKGFDTFSVHSGNGIISMQSRAAIMKADLKIESVIAEGTTVRLHVKIK